MSKKLRCLSVAVLLIFASCSRDESFEENAAIPEAQRTPLSSQEINTRIDNAIQTKGEFNWKQFSGYELWSATMNGNHVVSIGFGSSANDYEKAKSPRASQMQNELLSFIATAEGTGSKEILIDSDPYLNTMDVLIQKQETLLALMKRKNIRYIEPGDYRYFSVANAMMKPGDLSQSSSSVSSGSGCGYDAVALSPADYTTVLPNAKAGWTLYQHNIPAAWNFSTGAGVTIGIIDTGTSPEQTMLGSSFNNGYSTGRSIQKFGTYVDSMWPWSTGTDGPNDMCGHGTSMASAAAAPRNANGLPVGVAYNANLVTYRAASNVVLDGYHEQNGVKNAFTALGNNASVKIISMSMGHIFSVGKIEDGVKYAHNKGKLIFCAGGTSTSFTNFVGVIFPASMSQTIAVTGVKEATTLQKCDDCHSGGKIEFTIVMQRATGNTAPVLSYYSGQADYVGGSSVATATTAGIAALVWSKNPSWTRDQVLNKMRQSSSSYPTKNAQFGYGNINALLAVQ